MLIAIQLRSMNVIDTAIAVEARMDVQYAVSSPGALFKLQRLLPTRSQGAGVLKSFLFLAQLCTNRPACRGG